MPVAEVVPEEITAEVATDCQAPAEMAYEEPVYEMPVEVATDCQVPAETYEEPVYEMPVAEMAYEEPVYEMPVMAEPETSDCIQGTYEDYNPPQAEVTY